MTTETVVITQQQSPTATVTTQSTTTATATQQTNQTAINEERKYVHVVTREGGARGEKGDTGGVYGVSNLPDNQIEIIQEEMYVKPVQWASTQW